MEPQKDDFKRAYDWALSHEFTEIEIDYASKLALKMLDDSCAMSHDDRKIFFNVYDAIVDREDIKLISDVDNLLLLARNRQSIYSKPEFAPVVHACRLDIMPTAEKKYMKRFKKMVRKNLGLVQKDDDPEGNFF
jgi:hypothetical protein